MQNETEGCAITSKGTETNKKCLQPETEPSTMAPKRNEGELSILTLPNQINKATSKKIMIIGGDQCRGLASELVRSRMNSKYDKYDIFYAFL